MDVDHFLTVGTRQLPLMTQLLVPCLHTEITAAETAPYDAKI